MMIKLVPPGTYSDGPIAQMIKVASRGLRGNDRNAFIKRAGHDMLDIIDHRMPGEELIHLFAMGSTEAIGPNRNGDGFRASALEKRAYTFVKHAKWFRNHKNKKGDPSYGRVIKAAYHAPMGRVEQIVGLFSTKEAACKYGGFIADAELDDLNAGRDLAVSMACLLPFDVCSGCGHQARRPQDYCDESMCKRGGLRNNLSLVCDDGHVLHADNYDVTFFDISRVHRPADRIGYVTGRIKAAADLDWYDPRDLEIPDRIFIPAGATARTQKAARAAIRLAIAEVEAAGDELATAVHPSFSGRYAGSLDQAHSSELFLALAREKIALSLEDWLCASCGSRSDAAAAAPEIAARLPGAFCRLTARDDFQEKIAEAAATFADSSAMPIAELALLRREYGHGEKQAIDRTGLAVIRGISAPKLSPFAGPITDDDDSADTLALKYAAYNAAVVAEIPVDSGDFGVACSLLARRNRIV